MKNSRYKSEGGLNVALSTLSNTGDCKPGKFAQDRLNPEVIMLPTLNPHLTLSIFNVDIIREISRLGFFGIGAKRVQYRIA